MYVGKLIHNKRIIKIGCFAFAITDDFKFCCILK